MKRHIAALTWGIQVVPGQNDRGRQVLVCGGDQFGIAGFRHRAALAFAPAVDAGAVEQMAAGAGLEAHQPGD
jgi:hypothetical protein